MRHAIARLVHALIASAAVAAALVIFLSLSLGANTSLSATQVFFASLNTRALESRHASSLISERTQDGSQDSLKANCAKPVLTDGTAIRLKFLRPVASSRVIAGEKVPLEVIETVFAGQLIAIPQHSAEQAIVTMSQADRSMGRGGNLQLKIESIRLADGQLVPVRAMKDVKGGENRALALAGEAGMAGFVYSPASPLGFLIYVRGKSAKIPAGAEIRAYVTGDFPLDPSKFQMVETASQVKNAPQ